MVFYRKYSAVVYCVTLAVEQTYMIGNKEHSKFWWLLLKLIFFQCLHATLQY